MTATGGLCRRPRPSSSRRIGSASTPSTPGVIFTPLMRGGEPEEAGRVIEHLQPWPDRGEGADVAAMATYLASDESSFVTGQALTVDGGLTAAGTTGKPQSIRRLKL